MMHEAAEIAVNKGTNNSQASHNKYIRIDKREKTLVELRVYKYQKQTQILV